MDLLNSLRKHMAMDAKTKCYACDRPLGNNPLLVDTRDGQTAYVGRECAKKIMQGGNQGWQPPKGGPRLYPL